MVKYFDGSPQVEIDDERHPDAPVAVRFGEHSLQLTEMDAAWLAENIQRELRERQRRQIASATPLTVEQKRQLRPGDRVVVRLDAHPVGDDIYEVKSEPWQLGHGAWVIGLKGISGGYDLSRVTGIISTVSSRGPLS